MQEEEERSLTLLDEMIIAVHGSPRKCSTPKEVSTADDFCGSGFKNGFLKEGITDSKTWQAELGGGGNDGRRANVKQRSTRSSSSKHLLGKMVFPPTLQNKLKNPELKVVLNELACDPQAAITRYQGNASVMKFLEEIVDVIAANFPELRKEEVDSEASALSRCRGPLIEGAFANKQKICLVEDIERDRKEQEAAIHILRDHELRDILLDPTMQVILHNCTTSKSGRVLQQHLCSPTIASKLRKLASAGLIRIEGMI